MQHTFLVSLAALVLGTFFVATPTSQTQSQDDVCRSLAETQAQLIRQGQDLYALEQMVSEGESYYREAFDKLTEAIANNRPAPYGLLSHLTFYFDLAPPKAFALLTIDERLIYQKRVHAAAWPTMKRLASARLADVQQESKALRQQLKALWDRMTGPSLECDVRLRRDGGVIIARAGSFSRSSKKTGTVPPPVSNSDTRIFGSISETSFSTTIERIRSADGSVTISHEWAGQDKIFDYLQPGAIIELTCTSTATRTGRFPPNNGGNCAWAVSGSVSGVDSTRSFVGVAGSGTFTEKSSAKTTFTVGYGGSITITAIHGGGVYWGANDNWNPVEYVFTFTKEREPGPAILSAPRAQ